MAKRTPTADYTPPMLLTRLRSAEDGTDDYTINLDGPFAATKHFDAWFEEAKVKGCVLFITAQLIPFDVFFPPEEAQEGVNENG